MGDSKDINYSESAGQFDWLVKSFGPCGGVSGEIWELGEVVAKEN